MIGAGRLLAALVLVGCTSHALEPADGDTANPGQDSGDEGGVDDGPAPVILLTRDADGTSVDDLRDPDDVCPADFYRMGGVGVFTVCMGTGAGLVLPLDRDAEGVVAQSLGDPGRVCPSDALHVGGAGRSESCYFRSAVTGLYLDRDRNGVPVEDLPDPGAACPPDFEHLGGLGLDVACLRRGRRGAVAALERTVHGVDVRDLEDPHEACPRGWWFAGWQGLTAVCVQDGPGVTVPIQRTPDGRTWTVDTEASLCPEGWDFAGGGSYHGVCAHTEATDVIQLSRNTVGLETRQMIHEEEVCPAGFEWLGSVGWNANCGS